MKLDIHELMDPALRKPIGMQSNSRTSADSRMADEGCWNEQPLP